MIREPETTLQTRRSACRVVPHRGAEPDDVAVGVNARTFVLPPVSVLGQADRSACGLPLSGEFVGVLDEEIAGGVPIGLLHKPEMNLGAITDWEYRRHPLRVAHQASLSRSQVRPPVHHHRHSSGHSRSRGPAAQDASPGSFRC